MLHLLDQTLEAFLRAEVPLADRQVDIAFEAPDQDWGGRVTKPTINLFLWDVRQNLDERQAGSELAEEDGHRFWRAPRPRVDCHYLVTAWTGDVADEHQLLGAVLVAFLANGEIPADHIVGPLAALRPLPSLTVAAQREQTTSMDFWSAVGGRLKPGLDLVITATVDVAALRAAGPAVEQYRLLTRNTESGELVGQARLVGGVVQEHGNGGWVATPRGATPVDDEGRFVVRAEPGDRVEFLPDAEGGARESGTVEEAGRVSTKQDGKRGPKTPRRQ